MKGTNDSNVWQWSPGRNLFQLKAKSVNIKISGSPQAAIDHIRKIWSEMKLRKIFMFLALLAIFIAAIGLLGLSSFMAEQRTKEIGVRKVLGATGQSIKWKLTSEFTIWGPFIRFYCHSIGQQGNELLVKSICLSHQFGCFNIWRCLGDRPNFSRYYC
jgi:hypothetical protein